MANCSEFSVNLALLAPSNKRQISFGMVRGCVDDNTPFYAMIFVLRDLIEDEFQDRVKVEVKIGPHLNDKAEAMMRRGLTAGQLDFLQGPMTNRAKRLMSTGGEAITDKRMDSLGEALVGQTA